MQSTSTIGFYGQPEPYPQIIRSPGLEAVIAYLKDDSLSLSTLQNHKAKLIAESKLAAHHKNIGECFFYIGVLHEKEADLDPKNAPELINQATTAWVNAHDYAYLRASLKLGQYWAKIGKDFWTKSAQEISDARNKANGYFTHIITQYKKHMPHTCDTACEAFIELGKLAFLAKDTSTGISHYSYAYSLYADVPYLKASPLRQQAFQLLMETLFPHYSGNDVIETIYYHLDTYPYNDDLAKTLPQDTLTSLCTMGLEIIQKYGSRDPKTYPLALGRKLLVIFGEHSKTFAATINSFETLVLLHQQLNDAPPSFFLSLKTKIKDIIKNKLEAPSSLSLEEREQCFNITNYCFPEEFFTIEFYKILAPYHPKAAEDLGALYDSDLGENILKTFALTPTRSKSESLKYFCMAYQQGSFSVKNKIIKLIHSCSKTELSQLGNEALETLTTLAADLLPAAQEKVMRAKQEASEKN